MTTTMNRRQTMRYPPADDSSNSSSSSTGFFSPREGRAVSIIGAFSPTPTNEMTAAGGAGVSNPNNHRRSDNQFFSSTTTAAGTGPAIGREVLKDGDDISTPLPRLHDTSWLGANVSAIEDDNEKDDDDDDDNAAHDFERMLGRTTVTTGGAARAGGGGAPASFFGGIRKAITSRGGAVGTGPSSATAGMTEQTTLLGRKVTNNNDITSADEQHHPHHPPQKSLHRPIPQPRQQHFLRPRQHQNTDGRMGVGGFIGSGVTTTMGGDGTIGIGYPLTLEEQQSAFGNENRHFGNETSTMYDQYGYSHGHGNNNTFLHFLRRMLLSRYLFRIPTILPVLNLFCVATHDAFLTYISYRRGIEPTYSLQWTWPLGSPSTQSMLRFGAFSTQRIVMSRNASGDRGIEYWRCLSSLAWSTSSLIECLVVVVVWTVLERAVQLRLSAEERIMIEKQQHYHAVAQVSDMNSASFMYHPTFHPVVTSILPPIPSTVSTELSASLDVVCWMWPLTYVLSTLTGQLWVVAFRDSSYGDDFNYNDMIVEDAVGCVSWGTAGVACAVGVIWPSQRLKLFGLVILIVVLNQLQSSISSPSAVFGVVGASFLGWSLCGSVRFMSSYLLAGTARSGSSSRRTTAQNKEYYYTEDSYYLDDGSKHKYSSTGQPGIHDTIGGVLGVLGLVSMWFLPILHMVLYHNDNSSTETGATTS